MVTGTFAGNAHAQSGSQGAGEAHPYTVKLSVYTPSGSQARAQAGQLVLGVEGTYAVQSSPLEGQSTVFGLGYYERNGLRFMPVTLTELQQKGNQYTGFGLGGYNARPLVDVGDSRTKVLFGLHYLIGKNLDANRFLEAKYVYANHYNVDYSFNGFQLSYGVRF
jgi:hypothetical protein